MFHGARILVVEDEPLIALALADEVATAEGVVVGPFSTVGKALAALSGQGVVGAILDFRLADRDVLPVAAVLQEQSVPFVVYTGQDIPQSIRALLPAERILRKPMSMGRVVRILAGLVHPQLI